MRPQAEPVGRWDGSAAEDVAGEVSEGHPPTVICSMSCAVREELATAVRARFLTACTVRGEEGPENDPVDHFHRRTGRQAQGIEIASAISTLQICRTGKSERGVPQGGRQSPLRSLFREQ